MPTTTGVGNSRSGARPWKKVARIPAGPLIRTNSSGAAGGTGGRTGANGWAWASEQAARAASPARQARRRIMAGTILGWREEEIAGRREKQRSEERRVGKECR